MSSMRKSKARYWAGKKTWQQKVKQKWYLRQMGRVVDLHGHSVDCQIFLREEWSDGMVKEEEIKPRPAKGGKYLRVSLEGTEVYFHRIVAFAFGERVAAKVKCKL